ncbi:UDP-glucose dehydrogenase family protein [Cohnella pontilimi]|nr:UDP-glucose/GDP-mannose dehydrogenase family protein [Cohnella pontilimi]
MKIAVAGAGVVGLASAAGFAELGHTAICVDIDKEKIASLQRGVVPYYEPGLQELTLRNMAAGRMRFGTGIHEIPADTEVVIMAVGTPSDPDGDLSLTAFWAAADELADWIEKCACPAVVVAVKSTVPVGTADSLEEKLRMRLPPSESGRVDTASVPEFMREGSAVKDFFEPARLIIGSASAQTAERLTSLHAGLPGRVIFTDRRSAELSKLAANAFLAVKISFSNEVAVLCEQIGADYNDVAGVLGSDPRIGPHFLGAGLGFGGSCLPKDTRALVRFAERSGAPQTLVEAAIHVNRQRTERIAHKLEEALDNPGASTIALLGLAFKAGTDDMREAPSVRLMEELMRRFPGMELRAYDPASTEAARGIVPGQVRICRSAEEALRGADGAILVTEWPEFGKIRAIDFRNWMKRPIIWDGRNLLDADELNAHGVRCIGTGRPILRRIAFDENS